VLGCPDDEGRDQVARAADEIVESAEHGIGREVEADFLVDLAQRRGGSRLACLETTAWQRPLAAVASQRRQPLGKDEARPAVAVGQEHDADRRVPQLPELQETRLKCRQIGRDAMS
jgi:hypothetical protein